MALEDDNFVKTNKPVAYTKVIEELEESEDNKEVVEYDLNLEFIEEEDEE